MPRIGATLAAFALIACSIGVNISRYPVVWEMAAPTAQPASSPQAAQAEVSEPAVAPQRPARAAVLSADVDDGRRVPSAEDDLAADPSSSRCAADDPYCCLRPSGDEPSDLVQGEKRSVQGKKPGTDGKEPGTDAAQPIDETPVLASVDDDNSPVPIADCDRKQESFGDTLSSTEGMSLAPADERETDAGGIATPSPRGGLPLRPTDTLASAEDSPDASEPYPAAASPNASPQPNAGHDSQEEAGLAENADGPQQDIPNPDSLRGQFADAAKVEPQRAYADAARDPSDSFEEWASPGSEAAVGDGPHAAGLSAIEAGREVVPVGPAAESEPAAAKGDEMAATQGGAFGFRAEVRRLPPIDEINPFLNDGHDPPVPDISGMRYPSTGAP